MFGSFALSARRQKLRRGGGLDGLQSVRGGAVGANDGLRQQVGGGAAPAKNANLC